MAVTPDRPGAPDTDIDRFADDFLHALLSDSPDLAANLGVSAVAGRALPLDHLPDFSPEGSAAREALMVEWEAKFRAPESRHHETGSTTTRAVLRYLFEEGVYSVFPGRRGRGFVHPPYPVTHLAGFHPVATMMLVRDHDFTAPGAADRYIGLLARLPAAANQAVESLRARRAAGIVAPAFTLEQAAADLRAFLGPVEDNLLLRALAAGVHGRDDAPSWQDRARRILADDVYPAYAHVLDALDRQTAAVGGDTADGAGAWRLPGGDGYYAWCLRRHTTTDLSPDAVHELGLEETARVQQAIRELAAELELPARDMAGVFAASQEREAASLDPDDDALVQRVQAFVDASADALRPAFGLWPRGTIRVQPVPQAFESSLHSQYAPPALGSTRPGVFLVNARHVRSAWAGDLPVLCYHEAFPGHHVQLTVAQERDDLPLLRRVMTFAGYLEGWAKYAETLPGTLGTDTDPLFALARLRSELYSTVNLVLDTGIHAKRWSRQQAAAHFMREAGAPRALGETIANRSAVTPGQLASYKIGMLKMLELRERFRAVRGASYRLADFHDLVLGGGALPLSVLARQIDRTADQPGADSASTALR